jgi:hypothetical protein
MRSVVYRIWVILSLSSPLETFVSCLHLYDMSSSSWDPCQNSHSSASNGKLFQTFGSGFVTLIQFINCHTIQSSKNDRHGKIVHPKLSPYTTNHSEHNDSSLLCMQRIFSLVRLVSLVSYLSSLGLISIERHLRPFKNSPLGCQNTFVYVEKNVAL